MISKYWIEFCVSVVLVFASVTTAFATEARMVINYIGTATAEPRQVPDTLNVGPNNNGLLDANCFTAEIRDLASGDILGTGVDCLSEIAAGGDTPSGSGVQLVGTTIFNLAEGRLVFQGLTTVQPVNWPTSNADVVFTHTTGANSPNNAVLTGDGEFASTGIYSNATAQARLSGQVDLSQLGDGVITFDCIFVLDIDLNNGDDSVTGSRYDATQGEVFWDRGEFSLFNIYRDDVLQATNDGNSFYQPTLIDGIEYRYEVRAQTADGEVSLGEVTLPGSEARNIN